MVFKMKLIPVLYYGFTAMDRRFSSPMLPWIVSEVRKRDYTEKLSLGVEDGALQAYNADFEIQFSHKVIQMTRFSQADLDPCTFLYLLRDDVEQLLYCYLFQAEKQPDVSELYQQMKEESASGPTRSLSVASNLTSLCTDISPSSSNFFEVLYIGKIKVWHKKVPESFIDDALQKFKAHDMEKGKKKLARLKSEIDLRRGSMDSTSSLGSNEIIGVPRLKRSHSLITDLSIKSPDIDRKIPTCIERISEAIDDVEDAEVGGNDARILQKNDSTESTNSRKEQEEINLAKLELEMKTDLDDHNRTMVLQVDRTDLRLISPDRKVILLHKQHRDVTTCTQGLINPEHFGFISREASTVNTYIGYVFKCESASVCSEAVVAITQAFNNADFKMQHRPSITSCEHCPMVWYHKLCSEVENLTDRKTQAAIFRKIDLLDEEEQTVVLTKFRGAETDSLREQNEFLMMLLRAHCEMKQNRHVHDTAENRSEFLNQYLGNSTIFMKAKRSLTNSFDHLLKRKASKDDFNPILRELNLPITTISREQSPSNSNAGGFNESDRDSDGPHSRSSTVSSQELKDTCEKLIKNSVSPDRSTPSADKLLKSPMMDIFYKVGSSPKINHPEDGAPPKHDNASWRQAIFKRVVTPSIPIDENRRKFTKDELHGLWKKAMHQAILLVRMEKENARIKAQLEDKAVKRIKLEYDEMKPKHGDSMEVWELITNNDRRITRDNKMLLHAIRQGVPRGKRGDVWHFLAEEFCTKVPPIDILKCPNYNTPYETLLKQLTSHQHAILIDLGRTFPAHVYYSSPLGPGQLALFNLLKAYSLLDPEVGYCQGLSFVAGVLLLHMEESQAFFLLRHLMYRRELRKQYLPDMIGLQEKLYQLSRLLHDQLPDLYAHLDMYEVAPTLYAAPWLLTIFASQFPLGFVTRVFDLIFLESTDVIFRVVLALMTLHKDNILNCDSFEDIMNYLKGNLPAIDKPMLDNIMKHVYTTDLTKQLSEYRVEYYVLQEEIQAVQPQIDAFNKMEHQNKQLNDRNRALSSQLELALASVQRLELNRTSQQSNINKLETQNRALEVTIATLGHFINELIEDKVDIEIPGEVRRIVSHISFAERKKSDVKNSNNIFSMFKKSTENKNNPNRLMVKSFSTGKISLNASKGDLFKPNSLNRQIIPENATNDGKKFFSSSHKDILTQKLHQNVKIDIKVDPFLDEILASPTNSIDSGVGTPLSPKNVQNDMELDNVNNNFELIEASDQFTSEPHPLSNSGVKLTYNGTKELKKVKSLRDMSRNISPDLLSK